MHEASALNGLSFDPFLFQQDCCVSPEVDIGGCQVDDGLVGTPDLVIDEGLIWALDHRAHNSSRAGCGCSTSGPALDLALGLGMEGSAQDVPDAVSSSHSARSAAV